MPRWQAMKERLAHRDSFADSDALPVTLCKMPLTALPQVSARWRPGIHIAASACWSGISPSRHPRGTLAETSLSTQPCHYFFGEHDVKMLVCHSSSFGKYMGSHSSMVPWEMDPSTLSRAPYCISLPSFCMVIRCAARRTASGARLRMSWVSGMSSLPVITDHFALQKKTHWLNAQHQQRQYKPHLLQPRQAVNSPCSNFPIALYVLHGIGLSDESVDRRAVALLQDIREEFV